MPVLRHVSVARAAALLAGAYLIYYLWWRATATLNPAAFGFSLVFFGAEALGVINYLLFAFMTWDTDRRARFQLQPGLSVDVYVPTYDEPLDVLEATLTGCQGITYPHTTYVLDDGRRPEVAALAERLGCRYLTRPDNAHAKAGNLNAALPRTDGEFIVILDADMVPQPDFLDKTVGYFIDEDVALVQLPQEFYNLDSIQHVTRSEDPQPWHEQSLFYRVIQPGKNRWNAAFWCGSPSVVRRSALESVGGVATESITEDIQTSIRIHGRGWKTVYHDEILAYGIAPQTFQAFTIQRLRWAQGAMQVLRSRDNPLVARGLTLPQRLNYLASMLTYFDAFPKLMLMLTPIIILLSGVLPLRVHALEFLLHWVPYIGLGMLATHLLGRGHFRYLHVEQYNLLKVFTFVWASTVLIWPRPLRFQVTPKQFANDVTALERRRLIPLFVMLGMVTFAVAVGVATILCQFRQIPASEGIIVATIVWAIANGSLILIAVSSVLRRLHHRASYRFPTRLPARLTDAEGRTTHVVVRNVSRSGAGLTLPHDLPEGTSATLTLDLSDGPLPLEADIVHRRTLPNGETWLGLRFHEPAEEDRHRLVTFLFVTLPRHGVDVPTTKALDPARVSAAEAVGRSRVPIG